MGEEMAIAPQDRERQKASSHTSSEYEQDSDWNEIPESDEDFSSDGDTDQDQDPERKDRLRHPEKYCACCLHSLEESSFFNAYELSQEEVRVRWDGTRETFKEAAEAGCTRCALCLDAILPMEHLFEEILYVVASLRTEKALQIEKGLEDEVVLTIGTYVGGRTPADRVKIFRVEEKGSNGNAQIAPWNIMAHGQIPEDPATETTMRLLRSWIDDCTTNHKSCSGVSNMVPLPKRILEVSMSVEPVSQRSVLSVYLKERLNTVAEYACLSHSWGKKGPSLRLLKGTFQTLKRGLPVADLPKTFADAARVCYQLGIRYLWVDALCIRQDDDEDWKEAAAGMAGIYENGSITIAAVCSKDSNSGLRPFEPAQFPAQKLTNWGLYARPTHPDCDELCDNYKGIFPLLSRGWVYQERLLSPRTVYFSASQIIWQCRSLGRRQLGQPTFPYDDMLPIYRFESTDPYHAWNGMVKEYTKLDLTFDRDRLPALAALADRITTARGSDVYIAGMWQNTILQDITWTRANPGMLPAIFPRPKTSYPSWSWASVKGSVDNQGHRTPHPRAEVLDLSFEAIGSAHLGQVKDATITIRAPSLEFEALDPRIDPNEHYQPFKLKDVPSAGPLVSVYPVPDYDLSHGDNPLVAGEALFALIVNDRQVSDWWGGSYGIIVREVEEGIHEKIGNVHLSPSFHYNGEDRKAFDQCLDLLPIREARII